MSLKQLSEIAIQVESFRNIDLFHQGLYYMKFTLNLATPNIKYYASPYMLQSANIHRSKRSQKHDPHNIKPGELDES